MADFDWLIGRTISGRYRVKRLLGQGGMGKVYQAKQIPLEREVALKVLDATYTGEEDPEFHKRFLHEAAIMAKFTSPHTVTVFDYGRDGNVYFIAMELVSGAPLDRVLRIGPMRPERVIAIAYQVCRSLREAHSKGVVHRDLKPANVILTTGDEGEAFVKLMDFGLAVRMAAIDATNKNVVPGSPKYMSPEVIRQQKVDGRADIYALGVMIYQMLTGVVPFDRDNPLDILAAHLNEQPRPMKSVNPSMMAPPTLESLAMKCLAKNPDARFANIQRVMDALRAAAAEMGFGIGSGMLATSLIPASNAGKDNTPFSAVVSPRVAHDDIRPEEKRGGIRGKKRSAPIFATGALTLFLIGAGFYFAKVDSAAHNGKPGTGKQVRVVNPSEQTQKSAVTSGSTDSDMVFTVDELSVQNKPVQVALSSKPAGATVSFEGKLIGQTPTMYELRGARAAQGQPLEVRFSKPGYYPYVVKKTVDNKKLSLYVILTAREAAKTAQSAAKPAIDQSKENEAEKGANREETEEEEEEEASDQEEEASSETDVPGKIAAPEPNTKAESPNGEHIEPEGRREVRAPALAEISPATSSGQLPVVQ